jgi:type II secretory pathway pseudopilin PulG
MHIIKRNLRLKGFSLIELLVVATIIIVISAIGLVSFSQSGKSARDSRRKADLEVVRQALVQYRIDSGAGKYPYPAAGSATARYTALGNSGVLSPDYLNSLLPVDPKHTGESAYSYAYINAADVDGTHVSRFCLCAVMELPANNNEANFRCDTPTGTKIYYCVKNP